MTTTDMLPALRRENLLAVARSLGAWVLAGLADHSLRSRGPLLDSALFLAGALVLFLWDVFREGGVEAPGGEIAEEKPFGGPQWAALGVCLLLIGPAWLSFAGNRLRPFGLALLGLALAAALAAGYWGLGRRSPKAEERRPSLLNDFLSPRTRRLALLGIVLLAAVFRLYRLDTLPADMFNDLAHNYTETQRVLDGEWMIYGLEFPGREPLIFYLAALLARGIGLSFFTLKLTTALVGIATVPVVYLLGRTAANDAVGLVAALFLAVAKWHVLISRVGFRGTLNPLVAALVAYLLLRGLRGGRRGDFLAAGACVGLALYTYTAALGVIPAVLAGLALYAMAGHARDLWRVRRSLLLAALVAFLVALPMVRFMLVEGRDEFWARPLTRVSDRETALPGPPAAIFLDNLVRTAGMFHVQGDVVFRTNIPYDPHLDVVAGTLFLLGLPWVLVRWRRGGNALVLTFFVALLLPTALALAFPQEVPGAVRAGGALATVMIFPAVAVVVLWQRLGRMVPAARSSWGWGILLAGLALWSGIYNARLCFVDYPQVLPMENYPLYREIARVIDEFGDEGPVYLKTVPYWDDRDAIRRQTEKHQEWGYAGEILTTIDPAFFAGLGTSQGAVIVNPERDRESLQALQQIFPHGITIYYRDHHGSPQFAVFLFRREDGSP